MNGVSTSEAVTRALFHFLWEGAAIALALAVVIHLLHPSSARVRYALACLSMLAMLCAFGITIVRLWPAAEPVAPAVTLTLRNPAAGIPSVPGIAHWSAPAPSRVQWIGTIWIAGVMLFSLRSLAGWIAAMRIRRVGVCAAAAAWQHKLAGLGARIRVLRPVVLLESCLTDTPAVVGFLRPVILMPAGLLAGFPPEQIEFILLHELAHIRRYDYFVNLLQSLVENLLFYHPAVWWVSSLIRAERENCCDDVVVAATANAPGFAAVLAALEQNRWAAREAMLAANGGHLMNRIRRLLEGREHLRPAAAPAFAAGLLLAGVALAVAATQHQPAPAFIAPAPGIASPSLVWSPAPMPKLKPILLAQAKQDAPPPAQQPAEQQSETVAKPQTAEQREAMEARLKKELETPYKKWLNEEVIYIISNEERLAFNRLLTDEERQEFIEQFWLRRDPTPPTAENEYREEHYRRIAYANENLSSNDLPGWKTDRGMIYVKFGPPDEREQHPNGGTYQRPPEEGGGTATVFPFERWRYRFLQGVGSDVVIEFVDTMRNGEYHMTTDPAEKIALLKAPVDLAQESLRARLCVQDTPSNRVLCFTELAPTSSQFERLERFARLQAAPAK